MRGLATAFLTVASVATAWAGPQVPGSEAPLAASEIFKKTAPSVVVVLAEDDDGAVRSQGSGVVVGDGRVVTNRHVAESAKRLRVLQAGKGGRATLLYLDRERDLALLEVPWLHAPPAQRRPSESLEVGEHVYAVGAPQGLDLSLSDGLVSGLKPRAGGQIVQTTAPISPGSSGGGLFDAQGRLIGITAFSLRDAQNMNYALPVEWVATIEELTARLNASAQDTKTESEATPARVLAVREQPGGPAHLVVEGDRPLSYDYSSETSSDAVVQVFGTGADLPAELSVHSPAFSSVHIQSGEHQGRPVVTIDVHLAAPAKQRVYSEGNALHLVFQ